MVLESRSDPRPWINLIGHRKASMPTYPIPADDDERVAFLKGLQVGRLIQFLWRFQWMIYCDAHDRLLLFVGLPPFSRPVLQCLSVSSLCLPCELHQSCRNDMNCSVPSLQHFDSRHVLQILDTSKEAQFDRIAESAQKILGIPVVLISFIDEHRQWVKSCVGLEVTEVPRYSGQSLLYVNCF